MKPFIILIIILLPTLTHAVSYTPLVGIPGIDTNDFDSFINTLYTFSISIAALLAVIKITIAGVKYMLTDVVTSKGDAKKDIQGALLGLLVVVGAVLILNVINPQLTNISFNPEEVDDSGSSYVSTPASTRPDNISNGDELIMGITEVDCTVQGGEWDEILRACIVRKVPGG